MAKKKEENTKPKGSPDKIVIKDCEFNAVKWDGEALTLLQTVANCLHDNTRSIMWMVGVLKGQNVNLDSVLSIGADSDILVKDSTIKG